jgi:surface polysaccharide O-acyltransferase-like enzyme
MNAKTQRLYYLDWIRVLAVFGVFMFHALHAFDAIPWVIKNEETSFAITGILMLFFPWGLPLFFMVAGASTQFALRKRDNSQFIRERFNRLFLPFIIGSIILSPLQAYTVTLHQGTFSGSFVAFLGTLPAKIGNIVILSPKVFSILGWHLWFLGFLFSFALITLPLFRYLSGTGKHHIERFAAFAARQRGGLFLLLIPLWIVRVGLHGIAPLEHGWTDFLYYILFYIYGFVFFSDDRFMLAIRRDWAIGLGIGLIGVLTIGGGTATEFIGEDAWEPINGYNAGSITLNAAMPLAALCWGLAVLALAQWRFNFSNGFLRYGQQAIVPFYVLHQPIVLGILLFLVPTTIDFPLKVLTNVLSALIITLAIYEILIKRLAPLQTGFGMKAA